MNLRRKKKELLLVFEGMGQQALIHIIINIFFLALTWWALQSFRLEVFLKNPHGAKAKMFMILLTIAIAHLVSQFFLDYLNSSLMLQYLW